MPTEHFNHDLGDNRVNYNTYFHLKKSNDFQINVQISQMGLNCQFYNYGS